MKAALDILQVSKSYGALRIIQDLSLSIGRGERHALVGPNGAGKSTLFAIITGWIKPDRGQVFASGMDISRLSPNQMIRHGIGQSFQRNTLFESLTVFQNLLVSARGSAANRGSCVSAGKMNSKNTDAIEAVAERTGLLDKLSWRVDELSYGEKRQLEIAMPLAAGARILLLDEPAAGTAVAERIRLIEIIKELSRDVTLLLVEHDMDVVFEVCEKITVLSYGKVILSASPEEVRANDEVRKVYLGGEF